MILYHGTSKVNWFKIKKEGLIRGMSGGDFTYIYTCKTPEEASAWGDTVIEIDADGLALRNFIGECPVWQILINDDVEVKRIKLFKGKINRLPNKNREMIYKQGNFKCSLCNKKISFIVEFKEKQEKSKHEWIEFYKDGLCGFKDNESPREHGDIYYHGKCFWDNKIE